MEEIIFLLHRVLDKQYASFREKLKEVNSLPRFNCVWNAEEQFHFYSGSCPVYENIVVNSIKETAAEGVRELAA